MRKRILDLLPFGLLLGLLSLFFSTGERPVKALAFHFGRQSRPIGLLDLPMHVSSC